MSIPVATLAKMAIGVLAGTAIVAPTAYSLSKGGNSMSEEEQEEIQRKKEEDGYLESKKDACWMVIDGTDEEGEGARKLLVCSKPDDSYKSFSYYLYIKTKEGVEKLSKEIKTAKAKMENLFKITLGFVDSRQGSDFLWISHGLWSSWNENYELKTHCQVNLQETPKKVHCKHPKEQGQSFKLTWFSLSKSVKELISKE